MDSAYPGPLARRPLRVPCDRARYLESDAMHETGAKVFATELKRQSFEEDLAKIVRHHLRRLHDLVEFAIAKRDHCCCCSSSCARSSSERVSFQCHRSAKATARLSSHPRIYETGRSAATVMPLSAFTEILAGDLHVRPPAAASASVAWPLRAPRSDAARSARARRRACA